MSRCYCVEVLQWAFVKRGIIPFAANEQPNRVTWGKVDPSAGLSLVPLLTHELTSRSARAAGATGSRWPRLAPRRPARRPRPAPTARPPSRPERVDARREGGMMFMPAEKEGDMEDYFKGFPIVFAKIGRIYYGVWSNQN